MKFIIGAFIFLWCFIVYMNHLDQRQIESGKAKLIAESVIVPFETTHLQNFKDGDTIFIVKKGDADWTTENVPYLRDSIYTDYGTKTMIRKAIFKK
jgi:nitrous oxidase accessory protein NosD